jgi:hypothetical protein
MDVGVPVGVAVAVGLSGVGVTLGEAAGVGLSVGVGVAVSPAVGIGVSVGVAASVAVDVAEAVAVAVGVDVSVADEHVIAPSIVAGFSLFGLPCVASRKTITATVSALAPSHGQRKRRLASVMLPCRPFDPPVTRILFGAKARLQTPPDADVSHWNACTTFWSYVTSTVQEPRPGGGSPSASRLSLRPCGSPTGIVAESMRTITLAGQGVTVAVGVLVGVAVSVLVAVDVALGDGVELGV